MSVRMKRIFAIVLFATMVLTMLPFGSFAEPYDSPVYIGTQGYATLTAAIEAVEEGADTVTDIKVVADTTVSATSSESGTVLLDQKNIRIYSEGSPVITVNAPFKLSNSKTNVVLENLTLQYSGTANMFEISNGSLTVQGKNSNYTGNKLASSKNIFSLSGNGRLTVNGGKFTSNDRFITAGGDSECMINDATVVAKARVLTGDVRSNISIHGGSFTGTQVYCLSNSNITVTGGTFALSNGSAFSLAGNAHASVYGGTIKSTLNSSSINAGTYAFVLNGSASAAIYGGTFVAPHAGSAHGTACSISPVANTNANAVLAIFGGTFYSGVNAIRGGANSGKYYIYGGTFYLTSGQTDSKLTSNTNGSNNLVPSQALKGLAGVALEETIEGVTYKGHVTLQYQADQDTAAKVKFMLPTSNTVFGAADANTFVKFACDGTVITALSESVTVATGSVKLWNADANYSFNLNGTDVPKIKLDDGTLFLKDRTYGQTKSGTTANSDSTDLRFISAFAGNPTEYKAVGYLISLSAVNVLPGALAVAELETDTLYRSVVAAKETISAPDGSLWLIMGIDNIPQVAFNTSIYIRAYAVQADGIEVIGEVMEITAGQLMQN